MWSFFEIHPELKPKDNQSGVFVLICVILQFKNLQEKGHDYKVFIVHQQPIQELLFKSLGKLLVQPQEKPVFLLCGVRFLLCSTQKS